METFDVIIIGSGPAGMSAAIYAARAGMRTALIERMMPGGQMGETTRIDNYPGFAEGIDGFELAQAMSAQVDSFDITRISAEVTGLDVEGDVKTVICADDSYDCKAVVIASGGHARTLGLEREDALRGSGVSYCATCDGGFFSGKIAVVVGGGNTAAVDALYLSNICSKVIVVYRRDELRAARIYHKPLFDAQNVDFVWNSVIESLEENDGHLAGVTVNNVKDRTSQHIDCDALFVAIGVQPNTSFVPSCINMDESGYIIADETCVTSVPGVFAAGDVRSKELRQVVTAVSDGAIAAEAAALFVSS